MDHEMLGITVKEENIDTEKIKEEPPIDIEWEDYAYSENPAIAFQYRWCDELQYVCFYCFYPIKNRRLIKKHIFAMHSNMLSNSASDKQGDVTVKSFQLQRNSTTGSLKARNSLSLTCFHCLQLFSKRQLLKKHISDKHAILLGNKPVRCKQLRKRPGRKKRGATTHPCPHCSYVAGQSNDLKRHIFLKHVCGEPQCDFISKRKYDLKAHYAYKHPQTERPYPCFLCSYSAKTPVSLKSHVMMRHTTEKPYSCPHCDFNTALSSYLKSHLRKHSEKKSKSCPDCEFLTSHAGRLKKHIMGKHTGERPFHCPFCHWTTVLPYQVKEHIKAKHVSDTFQCLYCSYSTSTKSELKSHILRLNHLEKKPIQTPKSFLNSYKCPHCDYSAVLLNTLNLHIMVKHTNKRLYRCAHCNYSSAQKPSLKLHIKIKHSKERQNVCTYCDFSTSYSASLRSHIMAKHTGERPQSCHLCDYSAVRLSTLKLHIKSKHTKQQ